MRERTAFAWGRPWSVLAAGAGLALTLGGCTVPGASEPVATPSASQQPSAATPAPAPTLDPAGSADDNLAYFDAVNTTLLAAEAMPGGRAIVDNLVQAGFERTAMQVTDDETTLGRDVDSVQFSVRMGDRCLIGQAAESGYTGTVGPVIATDRCLLGETRSIDW